MSGPLTTTTGCRPAEFRILFVCSANVCRSPFAELLTRRLLAARLGTAAARFAVSSAGTRAVAGEPVDPVLREDLVTWRLERLANRFRSRAISVDAVRGADLVLTVERPHRSFVAELDPTAVRRAFCLREWNRLLAGVPLHALPGPPVQRARALVPLVARRRGIVCYTTADDDAIRDPRRLRKDERDAVMRDLVENVHSLVNTIVPASKRSNA
ncbi:low molecular weight phosphatase family protein [Prauserella muralis]|uniref:Uncharacterized protein n=1 Tax=Prauserella muralis TaxID=588067 RepID=A0A2V4B0R3_9PSEU|nr:low molecular weight phosphatase family protein [Prauserella muralis]PXY27850.1 hypothetical protein BAY60_15910 [Prauserella muralis]TWE22382.1 protein-tyrosine phosphatase [Prauserella muralis]